MHRPALQTITWGDPQHDRFPSIFAEARSAGFQGLEIGFRRLRHVEPSAMADLLQAHNLELSASHVGGNLEDPNQAAAEGLDVSRAVAYLNELGCPLLMQSGLRGLRGSALTQAIAHLNDAAKLAADNGVTLLYHNHDWEFDSDAAIYRQLRDHGCAELGFGPDLGWAHRAGVNLATLLDEIGSRVRVIHLKDFGAMHHSEPQATTVHLGTGTVDFTAAWNWLRAHPEQPCWVTVEQDRAPDATEAAVRNGAWLQHHLTSLGAPA